MDQRDRMPSSSSGNGDKTAKANNRPHGPAAITQDLPSHPSLKCPRCDSSNTKFCYYNNYSQTQPRHFCKSCRRYWTQGGTLRNVPVGGGCRKNKRVRPRSLMSLGGLQEVGPTSFSDTASNMLGRLSSIPNFGNGGSNLDVSNDTSSQLLNIAFARFQESMRLRQQSAQSSEGVQFSDMSLPALVHKPCGLSSCTGGTSCANRASQLHLDGAACGGPGLIGDGFDNHMGFTTYHVESGYCNNSFEIANPVVYAPTSKIHNMMGTSATATLATIEDELSNFSNLQYHVNSFNADAAQERRSFDLSAVQATAVAASHRLAATGPGLLPVLEHGGPAHDLSYVENSQQITNTDLLVASRNGAEEEDQEAVREEKPMMMSMNGDHHNGLTLMMCADSWQQASSSTNEIMYHEPHQSMMWSSNAARWQDMHPLASSTAAAGTAL